MHRWSIQEDKILSDFLADGVRLDTLTPLLASRTEDAIIRRACTKNYSVNTSKDGIKSFFHGVKRKNRKAKGMNIKSDLAVTDLKLIPNDITPVIVANKSSSINMKSNAKSAIILAMKILEDNSLVIEPLIVNQLSEHIIKSSKEII